MSTQHKYSGRFVENMVQAQSAALYASTERAIEATRKQFPDAKIVDTYGEIVIECTTLEEADKVQAFFVAQL